MSNKDAVMVGFGTDSKVEFDENKIYANDNIHVEVNVENAQYMLRDSLYLKYRTEKMPEGIWDEVAMTCVDNCDTKDYSNYKLYC